MSNIDLTSLFNIGYSVFDISFYLRYQSNLKSSIPPPVSRAVSAESGQNMLAKSAGRGIANFAEAHGPERAKQGKILQPVVLTALCGTAMCGKETSLLTSIYSLLFVF
jgi:hypothetical protein